MFYLYLLILILSCAATYEWGRHDERTKWININRKLKRQRNQLSPWD